MKDEINGLGLHTTIVFCIVSILLREGFESLYRRHQGEVKQFLELVLAELSFLKTLLVRFTQQLDGIGYVDPFENDQEVHERPDNLDTGLQACITNAQDGVQAAGFIVRRQLKEYLGLIADLQDAHNFTFGHFLLPFLEAGHSILVDTCMNKRQVDKRGLFPEPLTISATMLISRSLTCMSKEIYTSDEIKLRQELSSGAKGLAARGRRLMKGGASKGSGVNGQWTEEDEEALFRFNLNGSRAAEAAVRTYFNEQRFEELLRMLFQQFLSVRFDDLTDWNESPEDYLCYGTTQNASSSITCAAENLFMTLLDLQPNIVSSRIETMLGDSSQQVAACAVNASVDLVLLWDAVYLCLGIGSYEIAQHMDISAWISSSMVPLLQALLSSPLAGAVSSAPVLRRRFFWLMKSIAHLLPCTKDHIEAMVGSIASALALSSSLSSPGRNDNETMQEADKDVVARMEVVLFLKSLVQLEWFQPDMLSDSLVGIMESLCRYTLELDVTENRAEVVSVISDIVGAMGVKLVPVMVPIAQHLGSLWSGDDDDSPLRPTIIEALSYMVVAAGGYSAGLHPIVLQLIAYCIVPTANVKQLSTSSMTTGLENGVKVSLEHSFLFGDGLMLWLKVIKNAPEYTSNLDELYRMCIPHIFGIDVTGAGGDSASTSLDIFNTHPEFSEWRTCMILSEGYAALGGKTFAHSCGALVSTILMKSLSQIRSVDYVYLIRPIEALQMTCFYECTQGFQASGLLNISLQTVCASVNQAEFNAFRDFAEKDLATVCHASVLSRMCLVSPDALQETAKEVASHFQSDAILLMYGLCKVMVDKADSLGSMPAVHLRKSLFVQTLLTIVRLVPEAQRQFIELLPEILVLAGATIRSIAEAGGISALLPTTSTSNNANSISTNGTSSDTHTQNRATDPPIEALTQLMSQMYQADPLAKVDLREVVSTTLNHLVPKYGQQHIHHLIRQIPPPDIETLGLQSIFQS